ncbi:MAG: PQQ-like beta-propeller repeat protein [Planctomycetes bacterium]|nr:PQQ-like beta-propeller repeat protein [Planctomycetota bacterium]
MVGWLAAATIAGTVTTALVIVLPERRFDPDASTMPAITAASDAEPAALPAPTLSLRWQVVVDGSAWGVDPPVVDATHAAVTAGSALIGVSLTDGVRAWRREATDALPGTIAVGDDVVGIDADAVARIDLANGEAAWMTKARGIDLRWSAARTADAILIPMSDDRIAAFGCEDGLLLWRSPVIGSDPTTPWPIGAGGDVAVSDWNRSLCRLDAQGRMVWRRDLAGVGVRAAVADETLFVLADAGLIALDAATGDQRWTAAMPESASWPVGSDAWPVPATVEDATDDKQGFSMPGSLQSSTADGHDQFGIMLDRLDDSPHAGPVVVGDVVVIGNRRGLIGFDRTTGALRWRTRLTTFGHRTYTVDALGRLWAGGDEGELLALDPRDGRELLRLDLDDWVGDAAPRCTRSLGGASWQTIGCVSAPAFTVNGVLVTTSSGTLVLLAEVL